MLPIVATLKNSNNLNRNIMPNNENECFIAIYDDEYCGVGASLKIALEALKATDAVFKDEEVEFYKATKINVEFQVVEVPE